MPLFFDVNSDCQQGVLAFGNFDGVHRGHQAMIAELRKSADRLGGPAIAVTFNPAPVSILRPGKAPPLLTTVEQKAELLHSAGVDHVVAYQTTQELLNLSAHEFFDQVVLGEFKAIGLVEGPNFFFGKDRAGDVHLLTELCKVAGINFQVVQPVETDAAMISSTRIRQLIMEGDVSTAAELLGRPYEIASTVVYGASRGKDLGFPTANLDQGLTLVPKPGVYAGIGTVGIDRYRAAIHVGPNSTFGESEPSTEVHLLDFDGDLYGQQLRVSFMKFLRETTKFESPQQLIAQLQADCDMIRQLAIDLPTR
ncbi:bifunctional riboflavin kinase/FAD synthetase [Calycomorphotria hydatis]|uniref:Riboflavin biosynthesis protein n=1 Tax=Calycomorphotria hydatis TaxID=2528027 RepID=A0A517T9R2_9PLAN|nr:bifunctional riboflavin kinase/FAD synthetase [Calycomorphotria hydatis]QDT65106.1 Riboflavin kinase [Calycomorphotria hydatis]